MSLDLRKQNWRCILCREKCSSREAGKEHCLTAHKPDLDKELQKWQIFIHRNCRDINARDEFGKSSLAIQLANDAAEYDEDGDLAAVGLAFQNLEDNKNFVEKLSKQEQAKYKMTVRNKILQERSEKREEIEKLKKSSKEKRTQCKVCGCFFGRLKEHIGSAVWIKKDKQHIRAFAEMKKEDEQGDEH
jgi:hypothetical protein